MPRLFEGPGIWIILVVVILLFGATRLPALARSIGQSTKILRNEMKSDPDAAADPAASAAPGTPAATAAPAAVAEPVAKAVAPDQAAPKKPGKSGKTAKS